MYIDNIRPWSNKLVVGDCRDIMATMPPGLIHMVVTSPPYWGLRDYSAPDSVWGGDPDCEHDWRESRPRRTRQSSDIRDEQNKHYSAPANAVGGTICSRCGAWKGSLGQEPTLELYISNLVDIFRSIKRVLRDDGAVFLNLGDSLGGSGVPGGDFTIGHSKFGADQYNRQYSRDGTGIKPLDLCGVPWAVATALRADGWYLRCDIIWSKGVSFDPDRAGAVMPHPYHGTRFVRHRIKVKSMSKNDPRYRAGSCKSRSAASCNEPTATEWIDCPGCPICDPHDGYILKHNNWRPTAAHEYVFLLIKKPGAYFDSDAVKEPVQSSSLDRASRHLYSTPSDGSGASITPLGGEVMGERFVPPDGRNMRSVWSIGILSYRGGHFATFPPALVEPCIKVGTSERGVCSKCGAPYARVIDQDVELEPGRKVIGIGIKTVRCSGATTIHHTKTTIVDWYPTCDCNVGDPVPAIVYDPFMGSGTTGMVAKRLGRYYVGTDVSSEYVKLAGQRIEDDQVFPGCSLF